MDTLTHALSGALLARATTPTQPRADQLPLHTRLWVGGITAAFPDSDFIVRFFDPLLFLTTHRGVTHSIILLPIWALVLAFIFSRFNNGRHPWKAYFSVCALSLGIHIAGDVITSFGTMIFAPFSSMRFEFPFTFIIDPYFTGIIVIGLILSAVWKSIGRQPAIISLAVLAMYVGFEGVLYHQALNIGMAYHQAQQFDHAEIRALPQPLSPFNRMVVVTHNDIYHIAYINLLRDDMARIPDDAGWFRRLHASYLPTDNAEWKQVPRFGKSRKQAVLARQIWQEQAFADYRQFTMFPALYRVDNGPEAICVWFNDLRFSLAGRPNPFRYGLCNNGEGIWRIFRLAQRNGRDIISALD